MEQNKINEQGQDLPETLYTLIGEFVLRFPKLSPKKQNQAKIQLANSLALSYSEYKDILIDNFTIPFIESKEFKRLYKDAESNLLKCADKLIRKNKLWEYRDIILDNYTLTITALINIAEYCFQHTKNILDSCRLYCKLGYTEFDNRYGNENYLINFINSWTNFAVEKGVNRTKAQLSLLMCFDEIDSEYYDLAFDSKEKIGIWSFFPFTIGNIDKLVDFIQNFDNFDSDYFKRKNFSENNDEPDESSLNNDSIEMAGNFDKELEHLLKEIEIKYDSPGTEDYPWHSLVCNFYVYLFNKANEQYPYSSFAVCAYSKWLTSNLNIISQYIPEISSSEFQSLLLDYALEKYSDVTTIVDYDDHFNYILKNEHEYDKIVNIMYKLHYKTEISNFELTDIWVNFVINKALSFKNHSLQETAPILKVSEGKYPEDGEILLPWKYVRYVDGKAFFYHPNHEKGINSTLPFKLEIEKAQKSFMDINKSILWNFPFIQCKTDKGKIVGIDEYFAKYVISELSYIQDVIRRRNSVLNYSNCTAKDILIHYKSQQLDFLEKKQLKKYEIIPVLEKTANLSAQREEPSLIFTVAANSEMCTLVYENTFISRASYIFIVERDSYDMALNLIISYFTSKSINKRAELQYSRDMFTKADGFLRVIRVPHEDSNWEFAINFYSKQQV